MPAANGSTCPPRTAPELTREAVRPVPHHAAAPHRQLQQARHKHQLAVILGQQLLLGGRLQPAQDLRTGWGGVGWRVGRWDKVRACVVSGCGGRVCSSGAWVWALRCEGPWCEGQGLAPAQGRSSAPRRGCPSPLHPSRRHRPRPPQAAATSAPCLPHMVHQHVEGGGVAQHHAHVRQLSVRLLGVAGAGGSRRLRILVDAACGD